MNIKIDTLLNEEKYEDAIELIKGEYITLYDKMLNKKNAKRPQNNDFYCYTTKVINEYPDLKNRLDYLRNIILQDDLSYLNEISVLKNTYDYLNYNTLEFFRTSE